MIEILNDSDEDAEIRNFKERLGSGFYWYDDYHCLCFVKPKHIDRSRESHDIDEEICIAFVQSSKELKGAVKIHNWLRNKEL